MTTEYIHRVTIACPEALIESANHLACLLGESAKDISTFGAPNHVDTQGARYAVISTVVKQGFLDVLTEGLPAELPRHAKPVDRQIAAEAMATLDEPGGLMMVIDVPAQESVAQMGLATIRAGILQ